jgi:dienelactone hydrolase
MGAVPITRSRSTRPGLPLSRSTCGRREALGGPGGRPRRIPETLPDAYGALLYLKGHPAIDPEKIGIMGFSWGGALSLLTTSAWLTEQWTAGRARYAAHVPFYPVCYSFLSRYRTMWIR